MYNRWRARVGRFGGRFVFEGRNKRAPQLSGRGEANEKVSIARHMFRNNSKSAVWNLDLIDVQLDGFRGGGRGFFCKIAVENART